MIDENKLQQRMQRIGDLIGQLDSGEAARSRELLESVMDLHGEALDRVFQRLREAGELGAAVIDSLAADPVVSSVLLLYGLHPLDIETRVRPAVRIRFRGVDSAFTARTLKSAMDEELYAAAPDAASVVLLGLEKFAAPDFVPLEMVGLVAAEKA
jgi:hypothetical protein